MGMIFSTFLSALLNQGQNAQPQLLWRLLSFYCLKKFKQHSSALFHVFCKGGNCTLDKKKEFIPSCKPGIGEDGKACIKLPSSSHW